MSDAIDKSRAKEDGALSPERPEFAFDPTDPWTITFQKGLEAAGLEGKNVYEVGVGTGTNVAFLLRMCKAKTVYGSDLDARLPDLAERNVRELVPQESSRFHPIKGSVSLIDNPDALEAISKTDAVIACLPQVGDPNDDKLTAFREAQKATLAQGTGGGNPAEDHVAHYYPWAMFDEYPYNSVGLGLNEALLRRLKEKAPNAEVIMNFGARIGTDILFEFFRSNGYEPQKLSSMVVHQHAGTDISFFVALERSLKGTGVENEFTAIFYADPDGKQKLSACEAQELIDKDPKTKLYHEVCTIRGKPVTE
ncbi:MAG: s-adenosyl-l-methionine--l-methionine S-methyltransferase [Ponticaulis sp.]|nr:s-adenosyl-l-methionine--l-methionine S-methyltransferase [Ponticaulis sp.]|tara:strand:+ start:36671 stop:37594 length:924 start_codon:yes stop_codon:yes gene_type:complete